MELAYRFTNGLGRALLGALGARVHVSGEANLPTAGPVILAANHVAYPDFVFVEKGAVRRGRYVRFLTRYDAWVPGPPAWFLTRMRHVPVDRQAPAAAYLTARRLLGEGEAVGIFPEAGISYSFTVRALMPGVAALARETGAPVVPVAIWGSQRIWSVGVPEPSPELTRGRRVDVRFGTPFRVGPDEDLTAVTTELGHRLTAMVEELQRMPEHRPRPGEYAAWYPAHLGGHAPTTDLAARHDVLPKNAVSPTWGPGQRAGATCASGPAGPPPR
ncbi:lysophospholipid acyltransferase family protein [Marmoricola sp. RAF53]|uniref:lysophospholipid acyltransferase family protein n=1 Tax=Marmoricola sp. RAF53 TaxID=3233059 RepID=UPI003F99BFC3